MSTVVLSLLYICYFDFGNELYSELPYATEEKIHFFIGMSAKSFLGYVYRSLQISICPQA